MIVLFGDRPQLRLRIPLSRTDLMVHDGSKPTHTTVDSPLAATCCERTMIIAPVGSKMAWQWLAPRVLVGRVFA